MSLQIPTVIIPLLIVSWLAQLRLCGNMTGEEYSKERLIAKYSSIACLAAAAAIAVIKFF